MGGNPRRKVTFDGNSALFSLGSFAAPPRGSPTAQAKATGDCQSIAFPGQLESGGGLGRERNVGDVGEASLDILLEPDARAEEPWHCDGPCNSEQDTEGWRCPGGHRFCIPCLKSSLETSTLPRCLDAQCGYELCEVDLEMLSLPAERLDDFRRARLQSVIEELCATPGRDGTLNGCSPVDAPPPPFTVMEPIDPSGRRPSYTTSREVVVLCPNRACDQTVRVQRGGRRFRHVCDCGAPPFCARCREVPYHYHGQCSELQAMREQWLSWVSQAEDRASCFGSPSTSAAAYDEQVQALRAAICRRAELEADEKWKEQNCRLCPSCRQPVPKVVEGDVVLCQQSCASGSQDPPGCGCTFRWSEACPYEALVESRPLPQGRPSSSEGGVDAESRRRRAAETRHVFVDCSLCGSGGDGIVGLRFRCLHCKSFSVCAACEPKLAEVHEKEHVFEIVAEAAFSWEAIRLPVGTLARTVRKGETLPWGTFEEGEARVLPEGLTGKVGQAVSCPVQRVRRKKRGTWGYQVHFEGMPCARSPSSPQPSAAAAAAGDCGPIAATIVEVPAVHLEPVLATRAAAEELLQRALREEGIENRCRKQAQQAQPQAPRQPHRSAAKHPSVGSEKASERHGSWRHNLFEYSDSD